MTFSSRAVREMGAAQAWDESQSTGLGEEFVVAIELQLQSIGLGSIDFAN